MLESNLLEVFIDWLSFDITHIAVDQISRDCLKCCDLHQSIENQGSIFRDLDVEEGHQDHDLLSIDHVPEVLHRGRQEYIDR